jgi:hypothetical protein
MRRLRLSSLKGLDKFQTALMNDGLPDMIRWLKSKKKGKLLMDEVHKHIFHLGPPNPPGKRTGRRNYHQLLTYHTSEIRTTLDTMSDIEFYMGRFPYSRAKVAKHRHLQFHIEAFLQEIYILQLRLLRFATFIERKHKKDPRHTQMGAARPVLEDYVVQALKKIVDLRGSHVHQWRLSDNQIDRLTGISLYTRMPARKIQKAFTAYYESEYRKIRKQWREWVARGIEGSQKVVDSYFDEAFKLIFDDKGKLVYPANLKF